MVQVGECLQAMFPHVIVDCWLVLNWMQTGIYISSFDGLKDSHVEGHLISLAICVLLAMWRLYGFIRWFLLSLLVLVLRVLGLQTSRWLTAYDPGETIGT